MELQNEVTIKTTAEVRIEYNTAIDIDKYVDIW